MRSLLCVPGMDAFTSQLLVGLLLRIQISPLSRPLLPASTQFWWMIRNSREGKLQSPLDSTASRLPTPHLLRWEQTRFDFATSSQAGTRTGSMPAPRAKYLTQRYLLEVTH